MILPQLTLIEAFVALQMGKLDDSKQFLLHASRLNTFSGDIIELRGHPKAQHY